MNNSLIADRFSKIDINWAINFCLIIFAFSLPLSKALVVFVSVLMILFWLIEGNLKNKFLEIKSNRFFQILFLFLLLSSISVIWSSDFDFAITYLRKYWYFILIPIIFTTLKSYNFEKILNAFLFGMFFSVIMSYGIFYELWTYKNISPSDPSPFMDHTNYSIYLAFSLFIIMYKIILVQTTPKRVLLSLFFLLVMGNLFIIAGRTGQVAFLVSLIIMGMIHFKHKIKIFLSVSILSVLIFTIAYNTSPVFKYRIDLLKEDLNLVFYEKNFSGSMGQRFAYWIVGTNVYFDNFLIGTGIGDEFIGAKYHEDRLQIKVKKQDDRTYIDYHNAFVQYAVQLGTLGLILFTLLFYYLAILSFDKKLIRNLNLSFLSVFILLSLVGLSLHITKSMSLFALFAGLFLSISNKNMTLKQL